MALKAQKTQGLLDAILALQNRDEARRFLRDLLTEKELMEFSNRWEAAQMLDQGVSYLDIQKQTGLSSTTISRISKWLNDGMDGYKTIIHRLHHRPTTVGKGAH